MQGAGPSGGPCTGSCAMQGWANKQAQRRQWGAPRDTITTREKGAGECTQTTFRDLFYSPNDFIGDFQMNLKRQFRQ